MAAQLERMCTYRFEIAIRMVNGEPDAKTASQMVTLQRIQQVICPSQCSQRGTCVNGTCQCSQGRHAARYYAGYILFIHLLQNA